MTPLNLDSLTIEEQLLLQELLAERIAEALPDSLIQSQIVYHSRYMNGTKPKVKEHRHDRGMK